jgi:hypothetical protein
VFTDGTCDCVKVIFIWKHDRTVDVPTDCNCWTVCFPVPRHTVTISTYCVNLIMLLVLQ